MNKAELIQEVGNSSGLNPAAAERAVNAVLESIQVGLQRDSLVQLVGFGTFQVKSRAARTGRNPSTGEPLQIPATKTVIFRPGKALKESLPGVQGADD
ncbi:MAG: HU family DNA-binding protein [Planctomycetota bacterium]